MKLHSLNQQKIQNIQKYFYMAQFITDHHRCTGVRPLPDVTSVTKCRSSLTINVFTIKVLSSR